MTRRPSGSGGSSRPGNPSAQKGSSYQYTRYGGGGPVRPPKGKSALRERWDRATDDAFYFISAHKVPLLIILALGVAAVFATGLVGAAIRTFSPADSASGGTAVISGVPFTGALLGVCTVLFLGAFVPFLLYFFVLSLWFFFRKK